MHKFSVPVCAALLIALTSGANAGITELYEWTWSKTSANGKYRLVVRYPDSIQQQIQNLNEWKVDPSDPANTAALSEIRRLEATYPLSGVYLNDGSTTPIWTLGEYITGGAVSPDGSKVVEFYSTGWILVTTVHDANSMDRRFGDHEARGYVPLLLGVAKGEASPPVEEWQFDANWDHLLITWEDGSAATIRLDDFAIVQSDVMPHAFFQLFTTMQGITAFLVFVLITCGVAYGIARCFIGNGKTKDARR